MFHFGKWAAWWSNDRALDSRSNSCEFGSRPGHYQLTTLTKLFTPMCLYYQAA